MRRGSLAVLAGLLAGATLTAGCGGGEGEGVLAQGEQSFPDFETDRGRRENLERTGTVGEMFGGGQIGNLQIGPERQDALAASVNRHLWQASLDTLAFMPMASTDPFSGVIATDWASTPQAPDERIKVTAYITDTVLVPESLRVAVFREAQDDRGRWIAAPVAADTPRKIEDAILLRARQIRIAEEDAG